MAKNIIDVDHVSVRFNLANQKVNNLKEYAIKLVKHELMFQEFFALYDVSLHVKQGQAWGLIGTNGSGKSTLLKAIAGILTPYAGSNRVRGKIAPMIELGAGFDQEMTARENIFLNGAVLGHSHEFMEEHFQDIVDFANLGRFLDSPIKNYSSGMKARLGFSVATMVDPEILIVDEVLSVGDYQFRKKCKERMSEMLAGGTTLLYVSHNLESVRNLCTHAIWLDHGEVIMIGSADEVCNAYMARQEQVYIMDREALRKKREEKKGDHYDYLVVGAGLFGSVFAHEAAKVGKRCLVIDKRSHIGGNVYTEKVNGIDVHRYGAHIFHTSSERAWKYAGSFASFNRFINSPLAVCQDGIYNLPFNMNTFSKLWGIKTPAEAREHIERETAPYQITEPKNLEEQALALVGREVYEKLIRGYTEKQWGRDCRELPAFIIRRLPIRFTYNNNYFNDTWQGIPREGYTTMISAMLQDIDVLLETSYQDYVRENPATFDKCIYTGPIDEYFDYRLGHLAYRTVRFEDEELPIPDYQGNAVVNYTDAAVPYTRIIEHKHFAFGDQPNTIISREYYEEWKPGMEPYYPVNDEKNAKLFAEYRKLAKKEKNVCFGGRLGSYRYYNMDEVIEAALDLAVKELNSRPGS